jgi:hypothetical protein
MYGHCQKKNCRNKPKSWFRKIRANNEKRPQMRSFLHGNQDFNDC